MIMKMQPHGASITAISFSADGKEMASLKARWGVYFLLKRNAQNLLLFNLQTRYWNILFWQYLNLLRFFELFRKGDN